MRAVFPTMGTVASIDVPGRRAGDPIVRRLAALFDEAESRFSLYCPDSELSQVARGELSLLDASVELRDAYSLAMDWHVRTDGAFTPNRPDGVVDLNGVVKAQCIAQASELLRASAIADWSINVGGDIACAGDSGAGPWIAGIVNPDDRTALLASVPLGPQRHAVATSGSAERGDHIWLFGQTTTAEFVQITVVADDIVVADVLATAIIAGGRPMLDRATDSWPIEVLAVTRDGALLATAGFRSPASA